MADTQNTSYLSIGEVLGLLLEEFPDVTISKIRFLESQGLISPERTPSGYRKFYDDDVQLLRVILAEQRENYLPLRVIKDRLETGEIDPTGEQNRPTDTNGTSHDGTGHDGTGHDGTGHDGTGHDGSEPTEQTAAPPHDAATDDTGATDDADPEAVGPVPTESVAAHPAGGQRGSTAAEPVPPGETPSVAQLLPGVLLDRSELCSMVGMTDEELSELESFGVVTPRESTGVPMYGDDAVEIATPACEFLRSGVDARHLRNWRTSAEREASLYEQLVTPRFRQRNPAARVEALEELRRLDRLGGQLRAALTRHALRHHFDA